MPISKPTGSTDSDNLSRTVLAGLERLLTRERVRHSVAVARLAGELCLRFGVEEAKGRLAGLGHDIAREYGPEETLAFVRRHRLRTGAWERAHPVTLHGAVGRELLQGEYKWRDREVLDAVADHVLGRPGMGTLSQIVFAADFLEPERGFLPETERLALLALPLAAMVCRVAEKIFFFLKADKKPIAPVSKKMYDYFKAKAKE